MEKKSKKGVSGGTVMKIGVTAVALTSAAYYFLGPKGKAHRQKVAKWTIGARKKIMEKVEKTKDITEDTYKKIVDDVTKVYMKGEATAEEVKAFAEALKKDWKNIVAMAKKNMKEEVKSAKSKIKKSTAKKTKK